MIQSKVRIGLIGFGRLGSVHARNIAASPTAELVAICDLNSDCLEKAKSNYDVAVFTDIQKLLELPLDGVIIASSTAEHIGNIREVARKRIPIFTEKPIGLSMEETDVVLQEVVDAGVPFQIGFQRRWDPRYVKAKEIIQSGDIGIPVLYKAYGRDPNASKPENWGLDKNGGLFLNAAIHDYDAARFLFDKEITALSASGGALVYSGLTEVGDIDTCATTLYIGDSAMGITEWSRYATYGYDIGMEVVCTEGMISFGRQSESSVLVRNKDSEAPVVYEVFQDAYKAEIDCFIESIISSSQMSPGVEDARIALHIALQARLSFESNNQKITVPYLEPLKASTN